MSGISAMRNLLFSVSQQHDIKLSKWKEVCDGKT